jgi:hypothetical protein
MEYEVDTSAGFPALIEAADVTFDHPEPFSRRTRPDIQGYDSFTSGKERVHQMGTNETRGTGDKPSAHLLDVTAFTQG